MWVRSSSEEDSLTQLLKGAVDYTLMDELVVHYIVRNHPKESGAKLQIGSTPLVTRELHFAVNRARADAVSIVERFNAQIRGMIADRTYHRLLHVDWIRADVDGDGVPEYVPRNRSARAVGAAARLHAVHGAGCVRGAGQAGFLSRRQHLQRLEECARHLQSWAFGEAGSTPIDGHHFHVPLVSARGPR